MNLNIANTQTLLRLGVLNLARVAWYSANLRMPGSRIRRLSATLPQDRFFDQARKRTKPIPPNPAWDREGLLFGYLPMKVGTEPPDWLADPVTGERVLSADPPWWEIPDFSSGAGDIKRIWELSRFDWVVALAEQAVHGDDRALGKLNSWLADWTAANPAYRGPNWKCGQEASIRVMHLAAAGIILGTDASPTPALVQFLQNHLQRIEPTIHYAIAQDNNHGTSEATALFIGGSWLKGQGVAKGRDWRRLGRRWLENRAARLIRDDGSFSQYSLNYHRVMLDSYILAEIWRRRLALPAFSPRLLERMRQATAWLHRLTDPESGDAPNLGANDGARLLPLTEAPYRDYRITAHLGALLFCQARGYEAAGPWDDAAAWLELDTATERVLRTSSDEGRSGGFAVLKRHRTMALVRYPRFRFRPCQSDALHVDFWRDGLNILRDGGSYSYNSGDDWPSYFSGSRSHNTIEFDGRDQMPRMARFLFTKWIGTHHIEQLRESDGTITFAAGYRDAEGACHERRVILEPARLRVEDRISGFEHSAVLRWRLLPMAWSKSGDGVRCDGYELTVRADMPITAMTLAQGWESRHYMELQEIPVLEVTFPRSGPRSDHEPGSIVSELRWQS